jgi:hypothetical protein
MPPVAQPTKMTSEELWAYVLKYPLAGADDGTVPAAPAATPPAEGANGQGAGDGSLGLYDLSNVPDDVKEHLIPHLKAIEGNATKKFQEHADFRSQWEPYEKLGLHEIDPENMQSLLDFYDLAQDDDAWKGYIESQAKEMGLLEAQGAGAGLDGGDLEGLGPEEIQQLVDERVRQATEPLQQAQAQQQMQAAQAKEAEALSTRLTQLAEESQVELDEDTEDRIFRLASKYAEQDDPVEPAFREYLAMIGGAESDLLKKKLAAPRAPEGPGGQAATAAPPLKDFKAAGQAARERLKQSLQT